MSSRGTDGGSEPIVYIDHSHIREDRIDELKAGVQRLVEFIDAREPQPNLIRLLHRRGRREDDRRGSPSRFGLAGAPHGRGRCRVPKLAHLVTLTAIECYGRPSERALEQLRNKAAALGDGGAVVSIGWFAGFAHVASVT